MDKGIPPEERLLRLIRGKRNSGIKPQAATKKKIQVKSKFFEPANELFKDKVTPFLNFRLLNILLLSLLVIFFIFLFSQVFMPSGARINKISKSVESEEKQKKTKIQISEPKDYEYYSKQFAKRDIFDAPVIEKQPTASGDVTQAISNFKLVGIVLDDQPQAIIEDSATKETHFLNKGDKLDRIQIKEILESKVIVIYSGEEIELEL